MALMLCLNVVEADGQLPEYMKQAIEHGSFSKIHSIRSLASTLSKSQSKATLSVEQTRYRLLKGDPVSRALSGLTTLKKEEMEDTRNWELMPSIGGFRTPLGDVTKLTESGAEVLEKQATILRTLGGDSVDASASVSSFTNSLSDLDIRTGLIFRACQELMKLFMLRSLDFQSE